MTKPTTEATARAILARLAHQGPSTIEDLEGPDTPRANTKAFSEAFAILTRGHLVRTVGYAQKPRSTVGPPIFEASDAGHHIASYLTPPPEARPQGDSLDTLDERLDRNSARLDALEAEYVS